MTGENGILKKANDAKESTQRATVEEKVGIEVGASFDDNGKFNRETFKKRIENIGGKVLSDDGNEILVEVEGYEVTVNAETGEIIDVEKAGEVIKFDAILYQTNGAVPVEDTKYSELVLTVDVLNEEDIGEIAIMVTAPNGANAEENNTVTGSGEKSFKVDQNGEYTVIVETTKDGKTRKTVKKVQVDSINVPTFPIKYATIDIRFINGTGNTTTEGTEPNAPVIMKDGKQVLTPVNFNSENNTWEEIDTTVDGWESKWDYSYINEAGKSKWANAVVKNENGQITGYFVWIPRYAYKITYHSDSIDGEITGYSDSRGIVHKDGRVVVGANSGRRNAGDNFIVHPSFTNDINVGGWDSELQGIWVAKYEISNSSTGVSVLPGMTSVEKKPVGEFYKLAQNYNEMLNSHMIKNSEWGMSCYLSFSNYGIGPRVKVQRNEKTITGGSTEEKNIYTSNVGQSTTGNVYGMYDMSGCRSEFVAACVNIGFNYMSKYGDNMTDVVRRWT